MNAPVFDRHETPGAINLMAVIGALRRRKRVLLGAVVVVNAAALGFALLVPPRYTATATVVIQAANSGVLAAAPVAKGLPDILPGDSSVMATQIDLLRSRDLATEIVEANGLARAVPPPLGARLAAAAQQLLPPAWRDWLGLADRSAAPTAEAMRERAVNRFLDRLSVRQQGDARIIAVSFTDADPDQAARIPNAVVARYLERQLAAKSGAATRALVWADARVTKLRQDLIKAETSVADYMAANGLARVPEGGSDLHQLTALQSELATARADRATKDARLAQLQELATRPGGFDALPEVANSRIISGLEQQAATLRTQEAQLLSRLGPGHPSVMQARQQREAITRKIAEEVSMIARSVEIEALAARGREQEMEAALVRGRAQYAAAERASVELRELTRAAAAKRTLYETLVTRSNEIREERALLEPDARIGSEATVPVEPSFPKLSVILITGFVGSLATGTVLAALREHLDRGLHTPRQVELLLGVPSIGVVPQLHRPPRRRRLHRVVLEQPRSAYAEAMRGIETGMQLARCPQPRQVLLVTSALPGEGKTLLALSLAASIARGGRRVVVVDLDFRHPSVAAELDLPAEAGVAEVLTRHCRLDDALLVHPAEPRLHVLPTCRPAEYPGDLLASPELRLLIADLRLRYDHVVLDLPPVLGLSDVQAVGVLADWVLLAVQWGATSPDAVMNAMEALSRVGIAVAGTALTRVNLRRHALYGYQDAGEYYSRYRRYFTDQHPT